jgi:D-arabinose 1-dehydrogenase-like Zn-dependent alcohol dehydrogenase
LAETVNQFTGVVSDPSNVVSDSGVARRERPGTRAGLMRAVVVDAAGAAPVVRWVDRPTVGAGDALVRVTASGLCATDLKIMAGDVPTVAFPHILGHEVAGIVEAVGDDATIAVGTAVVVPMFAPCGRCIPCRSGIDQLCADGGGQVGFDRPGGLAEYIAVPARVLLPVPAGVPAVQAALIGDCLSTVLNAVRKARPDAGETAVVVGAGGIGLHVVQELHRRGAKVVVVEPDGARRRLARLLGAVADLDPGEGLDVASVIKSEGLRQPTVLVDCAGRSAIPWEMLGPGARVVVVGYRPGAVLEVPVLTLVGNQMSLLGVRAASRTDAEEALDALASGLIEPVISRTASLDDAPEMLGELASGSLLGRAVVVP